MFCVFGQVEAAASREQRIIGGVSGSQAGWRRGAWRVKQSQAGKYQ